MSVALADGFQGGIAFKPNPGAQEEYLSSTADEALAAGAKKTGKSVTTAALPLRYVTDPRFRCLILRRETPDLKYLEGVCRRLYKQVCPTVDHNRTKRLFKFPNPITGDPDGAEVLLSFLKVQADLDNFQGHQFQMVIFDELTQWESDDLYTTIQGELFAEIDAKTGKPWMRTFMRATTNPGGRGAAWVRERFFIDKFPNGGVLLEDEATETTRVYYKLIVTENVHVDQKELAKRIKQMSPAKIQRYLYGSWDAAEGTAFEEEFDQSIHVVKPFGIPKNHYWVRACDFGYMTWCVVLWLAVNPDNLGVVVASELSLRRRTGVQISQAIIQRERELTELYGKINIEESVMGSDAWEREGTSGMSAATQMAEAGAEFRRANDGPGSRSIRYNNICTRLTAMVELPDQSKVPALRFFEGRVPDLIRTLPMLPADPAADGGGDVDKTECKKADSNRGIDHWYDALTYGLMTIPLPHQIEEEGNRQNRWAVAHPVEPMDENEPYYHAKTRTRGY